MLSWNTGGENWFVLFSLWETLGEEVRWLPKSSGLLLVIQLVFAYTVSILYYFDYSSYVHPEVA